MKNQFCRAHSLVASILTTAFALSGVQAQEVFRIGFSAPLSGPFSSLGKAEADGVKIALDEMGNKFDATPVESKIYDDKNDPAAAVAVAQEAMQRDKLHLLIGPVFTGTAAATMQLFTNGKLPQFIVGSATSVIDPKFPYAFRLNYPSPYQAALLVGYATGTLKKTKVGIMVVKDALGAGEVAAATEELGKRNLKPVGVEEMNTGSTDVTGQLQRLKRAGAEVMYVYASGADAGAGPHIDHMVGGEDGLLVMLDHRRRVAHVAQRFERLQQPCIVALMQADRGLVQHIEYAGQA